ncbi:MAG: YifB family Mg chelatase-like AAA ATPase [Saccharofermentanales bacterium]
MGSYRYSKILSCALYGISGVKVEIEVSIIPGLSCFEIVGLGDCAIKESRNRVHAAIKNNGYDFPNGRITVGMAPGFIRKEGTAFDLPIAIGLLIASRQIRQPKEQICIIGEMSLDGEVRGIPGTINRIITARSEGIIKMVVPYSNLPECEGIDGINVYGVKSFGETIDLLGSKDAWPKQDVYFDELNDFKTSTRDISTIIGQPAGVRAIQIAAAGRHNLMMIGSPGCGKTSLANVISGILPELDQNERIEVAKIYSSCGLLKNGSGIMRERPFRAPHHNATTAAITGGGPNPVPGEITLAHNGVLFLDEMTEFPSTIINMLRQPMEEQRIRISRCRYTIEFPADFILIGAANPCKCGYLLERDNKNPCTCSRQSIDKYFSNINGPVMDRMDIYLEMTKVHSRNLNDSIKESTITDSSEMKKRVETAWAIQLERCAKHKITACLNSRLPANQMKNVFELSDDVLRFAVNASEKLDLSVRGYQKMIRIARTIADYDSEETLTPNHIAQALQFRRK